MKRHTKSNDGLFPLLVCAGVTAIVIGTLIVILTLTGSFGATGSEANNGPVLTPAETTTKATTATTVTTITTITTTEPTVTTTTTEVPTTEPTTAPTTPVTPVDDGEWNMLLVNPWNGLSTERVQDESNLVYAENGEYVDYRILDQLNAMLEAGSEYGLYVTSGYRSYETQESLYNNKVDRVIASEGCSYEEALEIAATVVARPGTSEHHTGLAVDLLNNECWELEEYWEDTAAFDWLMEHCAEYGFILRYPKESQNITGVIYEPWHYRYVGVEAAQEIMSRGITLEEYLGEY